MYAIRSYYAPAGGPSPLVNLLPIALMYTVNTALSFVFALSLMIWISPRLTLRITSYNVCYTKLLRAECGVWIGVLQLGDEQPSVGHPVVCRDSVGARQLTRARSVKVALPQLHVGASVRPRVRA